MMWFIVILLLVLLSQVGWFIYNRKLKKRAGVSVIEKYHLRTPKDAWVALANPEIPEEDKIAIKKLYEAED